MSHSPRASLVTTRRHFTARGRRSQQQEDEASLWARRLRAPAAPRAAPAAIVCGITVKDFGIFGMIIGLDAIMGRLVAISLVMDTAGPAGQFHRRRHQQRGRGHGGRRERLGRDRGRLGRDRGDGYVLQTDVLEDRRGVGAYLGQFELFLLALFVRGDVLQHSAAVAEHGGGLDLGDEGVGVGGALGRGSSWPSCCSFSRRMTHILL